MATNKKTNKKRKPTTILHSTPQEELVAITEGGKEQLYVVRELDGAGYKAYMRCVSRSFSIGKKKKAAPNLAATQHELIQLAMHRVLETDADGNPTKTEQVTFEWVTEQVASTQVQLFEIAQKVSGLGLLDDEDEGDDNDPN